MTWCIDNTNGRLHFNGMILAWQLELSTETNSTQQVGIDDMQSWSSHQSDAELTIVWKGLKEIAAECRVTVVWSLNHDHSLSGAMSYEGLRGRARVKAIHFPQATFPYDTDCSLMIPRGIGCIIHNAAEAVFNNAEKNYRCGWEYSMHVGMQCSAYLSKKRCFYFDSRDSDGFIKRYAFQKEEETTATYVGTHLVPLLPQTADCYSIPYSATVKMFDGTWFDAAVIYRSWALRQPWAKRSTSDKLDAIGAWVWNRGNSKDVIPPVEQLRKDTNVPVALDWYWWHRNPYDTEYPRYLPPREGEEPFKQALTRLKGQDIYTQVYVNGALWDMDDHSWKQGGEESVIVGEDGEPHAQVFNTFVPRRLAFMCGEAPSFQRKIQETALTLHRYGLDSLYLDVISADSGRPCYSKHHTHAPGGGNYLIKGYRNLLANIRHRCPGMTLASEACSEAYMDLLDINIVLDASLERFGCPPEHESIPLFNAVYNECFRLFGNYASIDSIPPYDELWERDGRWSEEQNWHALFPDQFYVEMARSVTWGLQPTICNLRLSHQTTSAFKEAYTFFCELVRFYHAHRALLSNGRMMNPGVLLTRIVPVRFLQRMVFTKEEEATEQTKELPAILHSCWEDTDGNKALILVNHTSREAPYSFENDSIHRSGTMGPRSFESVPLHSSKPSHRNVGRAGNSGFVSI